MENIDSKLDYSPFERALDTLRVAYQKPPVSLLERDGAIQRFEYVVEFSWKMIRKALIEQGRTEVSNSPKPLFRAAFEEGWLDDLSQWIDFIDARNLASHAYNSDTADEVYKVGAKLVPYATALLEKLKAL